MITPWLFFFTSVFFSLTIVSMGYFIEADGTVRSEKSVREEVEENLKKVNNLPLSSGEKEERQFEANIKKNIVTTEFTGIQQKKRGKVILSSMLQVDFVQYDFAYEYSYTDIWIEM